MFGGGKPKAVIVGGSIAGISSAHALTLAGWDVVVLEKSTSPPTGTPTGAGLGLDPLSQRIIGSWLSQPQLLHNTTLPLTIDQNQATDSEKVSRILTRDESFNYRAAHWADLHGLLYNALPPNIFLWGHHLVSFHVTDDKGSVIIKAKVLKTDEVIEIVGDLLVAADGCLSSIRQKYLPDFKLRYSGYCAWRGVLDFSKTENSDTIIGIRKAYQDLGKCLYFDLGSGTHSVFYELLNKKLNWIWYVNQPEPEVKGTSVTMKVSSDMIQEVHLEAEKVWIPKLVQVMKETKDPFLNFIYDSDPLGKIFWDNVVLVGDAAHPTTPHCPRSTNMSILGTSVTMKVSSDMIQKMHLEAEKVWIPELVKVMKETKDPFLNSIYDSDPLGKIFWDNVVLVGDAAHPTTPHCLRSTNMSILDAAVLGKCLEKWGAEKLESALKEYQLIRLPVTSKQVLHARRLGRIKQGLVLPDREPFNPKSARPEDYQELLQRNAPLFNDVPLLLA